MTTDKNKNNDGMVASERPAANKGYASPSIATHSADRLREALLSVNAATNLNPNP
jgi:hypothetical protein